VEMSRAMDAAAWGRFSNWRIKTEFCAEGMQPCKRRMKMRSGSPVGRRPVRFPASTMARAKAGMRQKRWNITKPARRRTLRSKPSRPFEMDMWKREEGEEGGRGKGWGR